MECWQLVKTPPLPGQVNMEVDLVTFKGFEDGEVSSTLRIYSWNPKCISLGYSQKIEQEIDLEKARALGWDVVTRPTGGGIVFHNEAELTYSLVTAIDNPILPEGMIPSYKKISGAVVCGLRMLGIPAEIQSSKIKLQNNTKVQNPKPQLCFSYPAEYEIVVAGKKIVGSAQKRGKRALLQQGSIFVKNIDQKVFSVLQKANKEYNAVCLEDILGEVVGFKRLSNALVAGFKESLAIRFKDGD